MKLKTPESWQIELEDCIRNKKKIPESLLRELMERNHKWYDKLIPKFVKIPASWKRISENFYHAGEPICSRRKCKWHKGFRPRTSVIEHRFYIVVKSWTNRRCMRSISRMNTG
jgi:hypothetical protein